MKLESNHAKKSCFATAAGLVGGSILALHLNSKCRVSTSLERKKEKWGEGEGLAPRGSCSCGGSFVSATAADGLTWQGWGTSFVLICDPLIFMNGSHVARAQIWAAGEERTVTVLRLTPVVTFVSFKIQAWFKLHCIQQKPWCTNHQHKRPPLF